MAPLQQTEVVEQEMLHDRMMMKATPELQSQGSFMELSCQGMEARELQHSESSMGETQVLANIYFRHKCNKREGETSMLQSQNDDGLLSGSFVRGLSWSTTPDLLCQEISHGV